MKPAHIAAASAAAILCTTTAQAAPRHTVIDRCSWATPGADRYTGTIDDAIDAYVDMPADKRERFKLRMKDLTSYDDLATITRDGITGPKSAYWPDLSMMHFGGKGRVCISVDRSMWEAGHVERAMVWWDGDDGIALPPVCGNLTRVHRFVIPVSDTPPDDDALPALWPPQYLGTLPPQPGLTAPLGEPVRYTRGGGYSDFPTWYYQPVPYPVPYMLPEGSPTRGGETVVPVTPPNQVPEPGTWALVVAGLVALWRRRGPGGRRDAVLATTYEEPT